MSLPITNPVEEIVPNEIDPYLKSLLYDYSSLLTEIVNYGSHILQWDIIEPRDGKDNNIPSLYLRNALELLDGISQLIKVSSIDPAKHLARSLFENNLNLMYLIEKDERLRVDSFLVWKIKNEINTYKKLISEHDASKEFKTKLSKDPLNINLEQFMDREETKEFLKAKIDLLKTERYRDIALEYEKTKTKFKRKPNWYSLYNGPASIQALASHFGKIYLYEFEYRHFSNHIHSQHVSKGFALVKGEEDKAQIIQIRDFHSCKNVTFSAINYSIEGLNNFVMKRLPDKLPNFKNWYLTFSSYRDEILKKPFNYKI